jgi:TatD DNase family protein
MIMERPRGHDRPPPPEPLPSPVVDTHCHLDIAYDDRAEEFPPSEAIATAAAVGVTHIVQIGCDLASARWTIDALDRHPQLVGGVSLHPNEAPRLAAAGRLHDALSEIQTLAESHERVRVVGETGLDYYRTGEDGRAAQEESFRAHIELAKRLDKTLQIHDRDAHRDVVRLLEDADPPERVIFHCFSGDEAMARHCATRGWYVSFAGPVTFKGRNADPLRAALAATPPSQLLVETDAPFLTPHPYRGRPNASYLIPVTVRTIAEVLGRDLSEVCETLRDNAFRAFGGPW